MNKILAGRPFPRLMRRIKFFWTSVLMLSFLLPLRSQFSREIKLDWHFPDGIPARDLNPLQTNVFDAPHQVYENGMLYYETSFPDFVADTARVKISDVRYSPLSHSIAETWFYDQRPADFRFLIHTYKGRNSSGTYLRVNAVKYTGGRWYKLDGFRVEMESASQSSSRAATSPVHGPFSEGEWYVFEVEQTGIYQLDRNFLKKLGVDVNNLDPREIKIYGWGGRMLPLKITPGHKDFIPQLAVEVHGEADGSFDEGDYILFYAVGKQHWNSEYQTHNNIYDRHALYYLQISPGQGKRLTDFQEPQEAPAAQVDSYYSERFYEVDSVNIVHLGREWYGPDFNINGGELHFRFSFEEFLPDMPVSYKLKAVIVNKAPSRLKLVLNGQAADTLHFPALTPGLEGLGIHGIQRRLYGQTRLSSMPVDVVLSYDDGGYPLGKIHLDYFILGAYARLEGKDNGYAFYHPVQAELSGPIRYVIRRADKAAAVWDITDPFNIKRLRIPAGTDVFSFKDVPGKKRYFLAGTEFLTPVIPRNPKLENQDLAYRTFYPDGHTLQPPDYVIIAPSEWRDEALRYVEFHRRRGLNAFFAPLEEIYREFGNGMQDIAPIRNYVHYVFAASGGRLKFLNLLGDTSWDFMKRQYPDLEENINIIPSYQSQESMSLSASYVTDDFFVCMDEGEGNFESGISIPDLAVGRIPVSTDTQTDEVNSKIFHYYDPQTYGAWHNNITLVSDDVDSPSNLWELNLIYATLYISRQTEKFHPFLNQYKIYLDAYKQVATSGGFRYPEAKRDLLNSFEKGTLILNYIGHGNEYSWSHERILNLPEIRSLRNRDKLPFVSTLTCEFGRFDNPVLYSGAELFVINPYGGAFQMITTTREVNAGNAVNMSKKLYNYLLGMEGAVFSRFRTPGEALMLAKQNYSSINKKLSLFGDPAMPLHLADPQVVITSVEGASGDTLKALQHIRMKGEIRDAGGQLLSSYNGRLYPVIFDKNKHMRTLNNDNIPGQDIEFEALGPVIFRGSSQVKNGKFTFEFIVPKDIKPRYGRGRINFYAAYGQDLRRGVDTTKIIGGIDTTAADDQTPPRIRLYLNDYNFADGGITGPDPFLLVKLFDENGINTVGGVGHDIVAVLDDSAEKTFILNDYYIADENTYKSGKIRFKFYGLEPGEHVLKLRAWDTHNNSGEAELHFKVLEKTDFEITRVLNYPNPFIDYTEFWFNHNRPFEILDVQVDVFDMAGNLVWSLYKQVQTEGTTCREITWNGRDLFGKKVAKGVYLYKLSVRTSDGKTAVKWEKLVKL